MLGFCLRCPPLMRRLASLLRSVRLRASILRAVSHLWWMCWALLLRLRSLGLKLRLRRLRLPALRLPKRANRIWSMPVSRRLLMR